MSISIRECSACGNGMQDGHLVNGLLICERCVRQRGREKASSSDGSRDEAFDEWSEAGTNLSATSSSEHSDFHLQAGHCRRCDTSSLLLIDVSQEDCDAMADGPGAGCPFCDYPSFEPVESSGEATYFLSDTDLEVIGELVSGHDPGGGRHHKCFFARVFCSRCSTASTLIVSEGHREHYRRLTDTCPNCGVTGVEQDGDDWIVLADGDFHALTRILGVETCCHCGSNLLLTPSWRRVRLYFEQSTPWGRAGEAYYVPFCATCLDTEGQYSLADSAADYIVDVGPSGSFNGANVAVSKMEVRLAFQKFLLERRL